MLIAGSLLGLIFVGVMVDAIFSDDTVPEEADAQGEDGADFAAEQDLVTGSSLGDLVFGGGDPGQTQDQDGPQDGPTVSHWDGPDPGAPVQPIFSAPSVSSVAGTDADDTLEGDEDTAEMLDGAGGNDTLILGPEDLARGGAGDDVFSIDLDADGPPSEILDFAPGTDMLELSFSGDVVPEIAFDTETDPGSTCVLADGNPVAFLTGTTDLGLDDISLMPSDGDQGDDSLTGTDGDDTLSGGPGDDVIDGLAGDDLLDGGTGDDILRGRSGMDELLGQQGADALTGGAGDDVIDGGSQSDLAFGNEGDDTLTGGAGNDELHGDMGDDVVAGGSGHDLVDGGAGDDDLSGGAQGDLLFGADGDDTLAGDGGDDYLQGGFGSDLMQGGDGDDTLDGTFTGGDNIFGPYDEDAADTLEGGDGDDHLFIGEGDLAIGGAGADIFETGAYVEADGGAGLVPDFDPYYDYIQIAVDPDTDPDAVLEVIDFPDGTGADIVLDGVLLLKVTGAQGLDPSEILIRDLTFDDLAETA